MARDAAADAADAFREDVRESLVLERRQAADDLQAEIDSNVQDLNSLERTDVEKNVILDQIRSLQGRLTEFLADNTNHIKQLQPEPGITSTAPSPLVNVLTGVVGGALVGILIALVLSLFDRRVRTADDVQDAVGLPVLAELGRGRDSETRIRLRNLLNGLSLTEGGTPPVIAVASVRRSPGAPALVDELVAAWSSRRGGAFHVMADLRGPERGYEDGHGLVDVLQGRMSVLAAAVSYPDGLRVLPPGTPDADPYALADPHSIARVVEEAAKTTGLVVLEAPPVLEAAESQSVCAAADGVILVLDGARMRSDDLQEAVVLLRSVHAQVAGVVIDRVQRRPASPVTRSRAVVAATPSALVPGSAEVNGAEPRHVEADGAEINGAEINGAETGGAETGGAEINGAETGGAGSNARDGTSATERPSPYPREAMATAGSGASVDPDASRDGTWQG
ncbi:hypothetical protein CFP66_26885 [Pseudonocardia sp. MH-G8]|nr:hypothetical protein CFP66_26885 [Pseudonocardia sp. MH-G8]